MLALSDACVSSTSIVYLQYENESADKGLSGIYVHGWNDNHIPSSFIVYLYVYKDEMEFDFKVIAHAQ